MVRKQKVQKKFHVLKVQNQYEVQSRKHFHFFWKTYILD